MIGVHSAFEVTAWLNEKRVEADEHSSQAYELVQHGYKLWHLGHLDFDRTPYADGGADGNAHDHEPGCLSGDFSIARERDHDDGHKRERHAADAELISAIGSLLLGKTGQRQDEQQACQDVGEHLELSQHLQHVTQSSVRTS